MRSKIISPQQHRFFMVSGLIAILMLSGCNFLTWEKNNDDSNGTNDPVLPATLSEAMDAYYVDLKSLIPASLGGRVVAGRAIAYDPSTEAVVKTPMYNFGLFSGYDLQYGGMDQQIYWSINAFLNIMKTLDPEPGVITELNETVYFGTFPVNFVGRFRWNALAGGKIRLDSTMSVGGSGNDHSTIELSPSGFKLLIRQENAENPELPRYITCNYSAVNESYAIYTYDSTLSQSYSTDHQVFAGERLADGSYKFFSKQWNTGSEDSPEFFGVGYATDTFAGFIALHSETEGTFVDPEEGEGFVEEYYNAAGDSVFYARASGTSEADAVRLGYTFIGYDPYYRLKYLHPEDGFSILTDTEANPVSYSIFDGETDIPLVISAENIFTRLVTIGETDQNGLIASTRHPTLIPYVSPLDFTGYLLSQYAAEIETIRTTIGNLNTEWIGNINLDSYHTIISEVPSLEHYAELDPEPETDA